MLDSTTKRRIDDCRDILVGKVPDPKSQIEQITVALIYKFMHDMDEQAVELGGKASFFAKHKVMVNGKEEEKDYAQYAWPKLFAKDLSGEDRVKLYGAALESMEENPGLPQLFRDIFKNTYLPYRDPATLREFLKRIAEFEYDHSEKLGDAFEYLLSIMGSQGDAGQFRTPTAPDRLHDGGDRPAKARDHPGPRLRYGGFPHQCVQAYPPAQSQAYARPAQEAGKEHRGL